MTQFKWMIFSLLTGLLPTGETHAHAVREAQNQAFQLFVVLCRNLRKIRPPESFQGASANVAGPVLVNRFFA